MTPTTNATPISRLLLALAGSVAGAILVALGEAGIVATASAGAHGPSLIALFLADLGALVPLALGTGGLLGAFMLFVEPGRPLSLGERIAALRVASGSAPPGRVAALLPLAIVSAALWGVAVASWGTGALARSAPMAAGGALAVFSLALLLGLIALTYALLPVAARRLAAVASRWPRAADPVVTAAGGAFIAAALVAAGMVLGDTGGAGPTPLAVLGVLRRSELDLRPLGALSVIALATWLAPFILPVARPAPRLAPALVRAMAALAIAAGLALTAAEAVALNRAPAVARALESHAPLGKVALALVRKATDRDHDGASPYFGGGDCNDHDPTISPLAIDVPGNGIDEDCSGADAPLMAAPPPPVVATVKTGIVRDYNLILITVDTLRALETGFLGYPLPTTPNLDRLAAQSVVFDRAYAMASYTGKALAPMLIGKYPSETRRDGGHFNKYFATNTFLAERLRQAGLYTMGAASHWYFRDSWGLTQGFDTFDLSAMPKSGQGDTDTSVTSPQLTDAAIRLLGAHTGSQRFFMWVHYFDPHEQYVPHPEAPDFTNPAKPPGYKMRALYDGEVWFTDKAIGRLLDFVNAAPWGRETVIVVTSDHGEAMNEHGIAFQHGFEIWEPLMRIPLVMRVPGMTPHHVPVKRSAIDLVPTVLDLMRLAAPASGELSGQSLASDLVAGPQARYEERDVYMDMPDGPYTHMRRGLIHGVTPGLKLIYFGGRQYQLYDLARDPNEADDLSGDPGAMGPMLEAFAKKRAGLREVEVKAETAGGP